VSGDPSDSPVRSHRALSGARARHLGLLAALLATVALAGPLAAPRARAQAAEDARVADGQVVAAIEVTGLVRVDRTSVRSKIYTQIGRPLNRARLSEDVKRIYRMGFFEQVEVGEHPHADGGIALTFHVTERPTVAKIVYDVSGDSVDLDDIKGVVDVRRFSVLDETKLQQNLDKIKELFVDEGHFLATARYTLAPAKNNTVVVTFHVAEGEKVAVRAIHIVGNKALSEDEIKGVLATREGGYFSFLTKSGQFKREHFEQDLQRIQLLYLTKGFIQVQVSDPVVTLSPDKRWMSITIRVDEGPQYRIGTLDVEMADVIGEDGQPHPDEWIVPRERLLDRITLRQGDVFDYQQLQKDVQALGDAFRDRGYANTTVTYDHKVHPEERVVDFVFKVQKGELVYFRRIVVRGNRTTRDKVIRREMKVDEGDLYSARGIHRSKRRVGVLGFFEKVDIHPQPTDRPDRMDLVVDVKEKQTGTFQVGAGFSSLESFILTAQISKDNFLGRGQTLSAQMTLSGIRQLFSLSFFEPYFLDTRWTFAFDLFNFQEDFVDFTRSRTGGNMTWGYRLTDDLSLSLTYTLEGVDAALRSTDIDIKRLRQSGRTSSLRGTVSYDTRNNRLFPSTGQYTTLSVEHAADWLGSENLFTRFIGRTRWYFPMWWDMVLKFNATFGIIASGDGQPVPLFENFFVGGIFTVRGFNRNSIGPRLGIASVPDGSLGYLNTGGDKEFIFNTELEIPLFPEVGIRGVLFFDAGNAWGLDQNIDYHLRTSVGFGFRWQSPVGPLRFEWGLPLAPRPGEKPLVFEFTIGNSF